MALDGVVSCATGVRIAQRGARTCAADTYRVGPVGDFEPPATTAEDARRADGTVWRRHWPEQDRMVIEFIDVASVEVVHASRTITFDRPLTAETEQHILLDHVLPLVLAHRGHVVLHGAVISRDGLGAVLVGSSGAGKSTLSGFAWRRGWTLGGDDGAVITVAGSGTSPPLAQPTYPTLRLDPDGVDLLDLRDSPSSPVTGKRRYDGSGAAAFRLEPVELRVVAIVEPGALGSDARFSPLRGIDAHAELFGSTFHAEVSGGRLLPSVIDVLATVVETTTVGRLTVPRGIDGLSDAVALLRHELEGA